MNEYDINHHLQFRAKQYEAEAAKARLLKQLPKISFAKKRKVSAMLMTRNLLATLIVLEMLAWVMTQ